MRGDPALLASLKAGEGGWTLVASLPPPPKVDASPVESYPAPVRLIPPEGTVGADAASRLKLVGTPTVYVTIDRRAR